MTAGEESFSWDHKGMRNVLPRFSAEEIDAAGEVLIGDSPWLRDRECALEVINNWRAAHNYPLNSINMTLRSRATRVQPSSPLVAQRIKRLAAIEAKLRRFKSRGLTLSKVQDLGGCRVVFRQLEAVDELIELYETRRSQHELLKKSDYIGKPKTDGYRSVHLIYKYRSESAALEPYDGLRIEVQIRSRLQHAWAMAVETVSTLTGQPLKFRGGTHSWQRFFVLMAGFHAQIERRPAVPDGPTVFTELVRELRELANELQVQNVLGGLGSALQRLPTKGSTKAKSFLLVLNPQANTVEVIGYRKHELDRASMDYLAMEQHVESIPGAQAVLVSVNSVNALRKAYPSYFLDSQLFLDSLRLAIHSPRLSAT